MSVGMTFGQDTVTFEAITTAGPRGALGEKPQVPTDVPVLGCRHRPLKADETPEFLTNIGTQLWKTTAPPEPAVLAANLKTKMRVDGITYEVVGGPLPFKDPWGQPFKVTLYSKIQAG